MRGPERQRDEHGLHIDHVHRPVAQRPGTTGATRSRMLDASRGVAVEAVVSVFSLVMSAFFLT